MVVPNKTALIMAAGTGGHVFPALAVANELREQGVEVHWLGTPRGMEVDIVKRAGIPISYIKIGGLRGKGILKQLLAPLKILLATFSALRIMTKIKPNVVLGMGGFVTGPGGVASRLLGKPLVIHEQNAIPGFSNVMLSKIATRILQAFPGTFKSTGKTFLTGNPVRKAINELDKPQTRYQERSGPIRLLIIGGSLGAQALNETVPKALALIDTALRPIVWHQTGRNKQVHTEEIYASLNLEVEVQPFIEDMHEAYRWADLVICRAGAMTITEISNSGIASILVPYPYAVDDHQTANAKFLSNAGAAVLIRQIELTPERLARELVGLIESGRPGLLAMAEKAMALAMPDATQSVTRHCLEVARG